MNPQWVVTFSAAIEAVTGVALVLVPTLVARLLLGAALRDAGIAVARLAGLGLFALGIACWRKENEADVQARRGLFAYNLLAGLYLVYLRVGGGFIGLLLVPACILHLALAASLSRIARRDRWAGKMFNAG